MRKFPILLMFCMAMVLMGMGPPGSQAFCEWGCTGHVGTAPLFLERGPGGVVTGYVGMVPIFLQTDLEAGLTTGLIGRAETEIQESPNARANTMSESTIRAIPAQWSPLWANPPPGTTQDVFSGWMASPPY